MFSVVTVEFSEVVVEAFFDFNVSVADLDSGEELEVIGVIRLYCCLLFGLKLVLVDSKVSVAVV